MPWPGMSLMDLRRSFIEDYLTEAFTMTELCASYGISRKTGHKMVARFDAEGWAGLADRSRRPHHSPHAVSSAIVDAVCAARAKKPSWGARKLRRWLIDHDSTETWPSRATVHVILQREGLVRRPRQHVTPASRLCTGLRAATAPNTVWTVDFKGNFRLGSGTYCYPLTLRDLASRYTLRCDALARPSLPATRTRMERAFAEFGLPECIRSDNGKPFAGSGLARLSRLNVSWLRLGIAVEQIDLGRPDQNGSHEQFHRVLKAHTTRPPAQTFAGQQRRFEAFRQEYNHERPHEALHDDVPARHYVPSPRPFPRRPPAIEYPGHWEPRRVSENGAVTFHNQFIFLTTALAGELVAFEEVDDGIWTLHLGRVPLARWLARERRFRVIRMN